MANLSKNLKDLFHASLRRSSSNTFYHRPSSSTDSGSNGVNVIYFYEWSDATRMPRTFYTLDAFDSFMRDCGIYLQTFHREILRHLPKSFVACKKGEKTLIIRVDYDSLKKDLLSSSNDDDNKGSISLVNGVVWDKDVKRPLKHPIYVM